jgi:hypothetical protein
VIDITTPSNPREVGYYNKPGDACGVAVAGSYAYVADGNSGLRIIDITTPSNPQEVGYYNTPYYAYGVAIAGDYAYVADGGSGLRVIDISTPSNPQEVGYYDTPSLAYEVAVAGNYVYVADNSAGLQIYKNLLEGVEEHKKEMPAIVLFQNEPNPFVKITHIKFQIPNKSRVRLKVYDLSGRLVKTLVDKEMDSGYYEIEWNGRNEFGKKVGEGIYFYKLQVGKLKTVRKTILLK